MQLFQKIHRNASDEISFVELVNDVEINFNCNNIFIKTKEGESHDIPLKYYE